MRLPVFVAPVLLSTVTAVPLLCVGRNTIQRILQERSHKTRFTVSSLNNGHTYPSLFLHQIWDVVELRQFSVHMPLFCPAPKEYIKTGVTENLFTYTLQIELQFLISWYKNVNLLK